MPINYIALAHELGYRVKDGKAYSKNGRCLEAQLSTTGRYDFTLRIPAEISEGKRKTKRIPFHRLVAFQKFGHEMFKPGILVRHKDNDCLNNLDSNILLGTHGDNMMDQPESVRKRKSVNASTKIRILSDDEVKALKVDRFVNGMTYQQLADKYKIGNKGQAHYVANHDYVTQKISPMDSAIQSHS